MMEQHRVLILCPTKRDEIYFQPVYSFPCNKNFKFVPVTWTFPEPLDLMKYIKICMEIIREQGIGHVISMTDSGVLAHAALCQVLPSIKGPSVESVFLAFHKYYSRQHLDAQDTRLRHAILDIDDASDEAIEAALEIAGLPAFLKPCTGTRSFGVSRIFSKSDVQQHLLKHSSQFILTSNHLKPYFQKFINQDKYPYSSKNCIILEELMVECKIITLDGCVIDGKIMHWPISDSLFWKKHPKMFKAVVLPSSIDASLEERLWKIYDTVVKNIIAKGFDNHFINVEVFVKPDDVIKVMEVNPRMFPQALTLYNMCIQDGDPVATLLDSSMSVQRKPPILNGYYGINGYVNTFATGKAEDLFDFEEASKHAEITCLCSIGDDVSEAGEEGSNLAFINLRRDTKEDMMRDYFTLYRKVIKKPEFSPWE